MSSSARGYSALVMEGGTSNGLYALLTPTAVSALPASLTNTIASSSAPFGMHLLIRAYDHTATGTITVAGTAPLTLAAVTETTTTLPVSDTPGMYVDYTTKTIYGAVNASGVTVSSLTNGTVAIFGVQAAHRLVVGEFKLNDKRSDHIPVQQQGTFDEANQPVLALMTDPEWEYQGDFYPDDCEWLLEAGLNSAPTVAGIPNSGTSLLGATSVVTSGTVSLSTPPSAPGMVLVVTITGGPAASQSVTVTGTLAGTGETITETICTTKSNGTYYSNNIFATVAASGVAYGAFGGAASLTITGYYLWQLTVAPGNTLGVFSAYQYDGVGNYVAPLCLLNEWSIEGGASKEIKVTAKGPCQDVLLVGDTTTDTQQGPTFSLPQDQAVMGWSAQVFLDTLSGTAGTTLINCMEWKVTGNNKWKTEHAGGVNPPARYFTKYDRGRREIRVELKVYMDVTTYNTAYQAFKRGTRQQVQIKILGYPAAVNSGTNYNPGWTLTLPVRFAEDPHREFTLSQEYVTLTLMGVAYKAPSLGYALQVVSNTHVQSWNQ